MKVISEYGVEYLLEDSRVQGKYNGREFIIITIHPIKNKSSIIQSNKLNKNSNSIQQS